MMRILLVGLGVPAALIGAWAAFAPRSFYQDFPGFVYHLRHLDPLASDAQVSSVAGLAIVPVVALLLLAIATDRGRSRATISRSVAPSPTSSRSASTVPSGHTSGT
jgi:hypothetical protein